MLSWVKDKIKPPAKQEDCVFCKIRNDPKNEKLNPDKNFLYEDEDFFVINDLNKATAQQHILVITKSHIRSALDIKEKQFLRRMRDVAQKVLDDSIAKKLQNKEKLTKQQIERLEFPSFRFGFHLPPYNSVDHIHLHGFQEPIESFKYDKVLYGYVMTNIQALL